MSLETLSDDELLRLYDGKLRKLEELRREAISMQLADAKEKNKDFSLSKSPIGNGIIILLFFLIVFYCIRSKIFHKFLKFVKSITERVCPYLKKLEELNKYFFHRISLVTLYVLTSCFFYIFIVDNLYSKLSNLHDDFYYVSYQDASKFSKLCKSMNENKNGVKLTIQNFNNLLKNRASDSNNYYFTEANDVFAFLKLKPFYHNKLDFRFIDRVCRKSVVGKKAIHEQQNIFKKLMIFTDFCLVVLMEFLSRLIKFALSTLVIMFFYFKAVLYIFLGPYSKFKKP